MGRQENLMKYLTRQEEIYLLAIWRLQDNAYGVQIKKQIFEVTGRKISYGALYFTLEQLFKKGYVTRTVGEPTPVRGGCRKIYYSLTSAGNESLKAIYELQRSIWKDISVLSFD
jgi:PadR family transcriptional regulator PadR